MEHTDIQAAALHPSPVLQVHRPHMAIKQAGGVGDSVLPCAESNTKLLAYMHFPLKDYQGENNVND